MGTNGTDGGALELHVYPRGRDHHDRPCYLDGDGKELWLTEEIATQEADLKHFSDSELSAEYWKLAEQCRYEQWIESVRAFDNDELSDWETAGAERKYAALDTLYRFATTDHYWQSDRG